jgi:DNA-binding transcriptional regulator of glucitol operon
VKSKWFSSRAIFLHLALIAWLALCAVAAWWQVGRAVQGNALSFMYSIEWPVFGVLGFLGWFAMLNLERATEDEEHERLEYEERMRAEARAARARAEAAAAERDDPRLAAYNDHLAKVALQPKKKLWGH